MNKEYEYHQDYYAWLKHIAKLISKKYFDDISEIDLHLIENELGNLVSYLMA